MDAQGPERPRPYVEEAGATFKTVVDASNALGELYGFKAIPNGFLIDETGMVRYKRLGGFDIRRRETAEDVERWAASPGVDAPVEETKAPASAQDPAAHSLFREGLDLYDSGDAVGAVVLWRRALDLDPDNYIIRKQIWAVGNPEMFYDGDVDYTWQREQQERGR
jgi:hypothetical protein